MYKIGVKDENLDLSEINHYLAEDGVILLNDISSKDEAIKFALKIGNIINNPDSDAQGVVNITPSDQRLDKLNSRGFSSFSLFPHTDRSPELQPPQILMLWYSMLPATGGETLLVDGKELLQQCYTKHKEAYDLLSTPNTALFNDGNIEYLGSVIEFHKHNIASIRFRYDACAVYNKEIIPAIKTLKKLIEENTKQVTFQAGEGYLINNRRWLHGRNAFTGNRIVHRLHLTSTIGDPLLAKGFVCPLDIVA